MVYHTVVDNWNTLLFTAIFSVPGMTSPFNGQSSRSKDNVKGLVAHSAVKSETQTLR